MANMALYKDDRGDVWFMGIFSNNFEDREGEIITWDAHLEYAKWFKESDIKLPIVGLHQPKFPAFFHRAHTLAMQNGLITPQEYAKNLLDLYKSTTIAEAEIVIPLNGFMLVAGKVRKDRYEMVEKFPVGWGMSHGFINLKPDGNIINKYRTFEFTVAPNKWAANALTLIGFKNEDTKMAEKLTQEERDLINSFLKGDAENLEEATKKAQTILSRVFNSKTLDEITEDVDEETETEVVETEDVTEYEVLRDKLFSDLDVTGLAETFKQMGEMFEKYDERFAALEKAVKKSDDDVIAEHIKPDWKAFFADHKTEGDQDEELLDELKEKTDRTITEPSEDAVNDDNPLSLAWKQIARGDK